MGKVEGEASEEGSLARWGFARRSPVTDEVLFHHGTTMVRRLVLAPGETMPWHLDPFHRVAVILRGDAIAIEYRDRGESHHVQITPGPRRSASAERRTTCPLSLCRDQPGTFERYLLTTLRRGVPRWLSTKPVRAGTQVGREARSVGSGFHRKC
jgi:hypothetical protein